MAADLELDGSAICRWLKPLDLEVSAAAQIESTKLSLKYRWASPQEERELEAEVRGFIENDSVTRAGPKRREDWNQGWQENFDALAAGESLIDAVKPRYFRENHWYRVEGKLAWFEDPFAEYKILRAIRKPLYLQTFAGCSSITEFGCGSGQNLLDLAELFPEKQLVGADWVKSSAELVDVLGQRLGCSLRGCVFDMENPDTQIALERHSGVLTYHALEQLGDRFGPMLDYLLNQPAAVVAHVEPIEENYEKDHTLDQLALSYHRHRGYLSGYLSRLRGLENAGLIEILSSFRIPFGSRFHEANGVIIWRRK